MNLDQIATKCFILALFIRDDGQRLLLGNGYYDFNQKLQHFQANTIANDIVEIQGDNGQLLAGQVMRSGTQKFEGYIGDATTSRQIVEQKRSDFMAFFRIKHFYKVVYIFPDGTAIQRQRGYLTDAPTIPEIFQKFPEYSIALNFEDANYYEYAEDEYGDEIYAHIIELALSGNATGGLVWDAIGAVSNGITWSGIQTAQGEYISITNELSLEAPLASVEMLGNATQAGTPSPDDPIPVEVVTGENTVKIEGKNLFDKDEANILIAYIDASHTSITYNANNRIIWIPCQPNTTYTLQKLAVGTSWYTRQIAYTTQEPAVGVQTHDMVEMTGNDTSKTYTTGADAKYLVVRIWVSGQDAETLDAMLGSVQLELGNSASQYEPYQGQEFEVNLGGSNLFSFDNAILATYPQSGLNIARGSNDITITAETTTGSQLQYATFANSFDATKTYTLSGKAKKIVKGTDGQPRLYIRWRGSNDGGSTWSSYNDIFQQNPVQGTEYSFSGQITGYTTYQFLFYNNGNTPVSLGEKTTYYDIMLNEGSTAIPFAPYTDYAYELAKIPGTNYRDRIYPQDGKWYIEKQVGKVAINITDYNSNYTDVDYAIFDKPADALNYGTYSEMPALCDSALSPELSGGYNQTAQIGRLCSKANTTHLWIGVTKGTTQATSKTMLDGKAVYYALATPTTTEITNEALIAQLDALESASLYLGVNNIGTETLNAMPTLKIEYYTEVDLDGAGYEWEPGGNTAKTIVTVAGVDSAWPIWTVQGGAQNPTLTNITTGQTISWQGFVPEGQTLTINMAEMTADLAGANVFEYITGEWIRLAPGNNTLVYTAGSADKPSTLSWNGVLA